MCSSNASRVISTSPGSSSTSSTLMHARPRARSLTAPPRGVGASAVSTGRVNRMTRAGLVAGAVSSQIRPPWNSTIFLTSARPMPVPGVDLAAVQPLEDHEDLVRVLGLDADAVVRHGDLPERRRRAARRPAPPAATSGRRNLSAVAEQVEQQLAQQRRVALHRGQVAEDDLAVQLGARRSRPAPPRPGRSRAGRPSAKPVVVRPTREKASRSLIRRCMRCAPSTAKPMYWSARSSSCPP